MTTGGGRVWYKFVPVRREKREKNDAPLAFKQEPECWSCLESSGEKGREESEGEGEKGLCTRKKRKKKKRKGEPGSRSFPMRKQ